MRTFAFLLTPLWLAFTLPAMAFDVIKDEIDSREIPAQLYQKINNDLDHLTGSESKAELSTLAMELGLSQPELFRKLYLTTRLNMEAGVDISNEHPENDLMLQLLDTYADNRLQRTIALMMKGRVKGRSKIDYKDAIKHYLQALDIVRHETGQNALVLTFVIHDRLASLNQLIRQFPSSLNHLNALQQTTMQLGNSYLRAHAESMLGTYYNKQKDPARALEHFTQALRFANRDPRPQLLAMLNFNLAKVHRDMEHWDAALEHAHKAAKGFEQTGSAPYLSHTMTVIAIVYGKQQNWHKAIDYYLNAHQIDVREGNRINQALNMHNLGEAYSKLNDHANSLTYLNGANQFFREKKLNHYLVYNEALLAEVCLAAGDWPQALYHATESLGFAREKKLLQEEIDAMSFQLAAYKGLGELDKALSLQDEIIKLKIVPENKAEPIKADSALYQQQLKLALGNKDIKLDQLSSKSRGQSRIILGGSVLMLMLLVAMLYLYHTRRQTIIDNEQLQQKRNQDPQTGHPNCQALLQALEQRQTPATLVLLDTGENDYPELAQGQYMANVEYLCQLSCIDNTPGMQSFAIRPGQMAILVEGQYVDKELVNRLAELLELPAVKAGIIPLPLLQSEELVIEPEIQFETAQMALYGARSLKGESHQYVGLHPLDFAPSVIFSHPLYLRLDKSIQRGLIRVNCSGEKQDISWPEFQPQSGDDTNIELEQSTKGL